MGLLDNFEKGLERAVNGAFAKTFKSGLQPVEITAALRRELDTKAAVVSRDRILVPNKFIVRLGPVDFERMTALGPTLIGELIDLVQRHAAKQGYSFAGGISVDLREVSSLSQGMIDVLSENVKGAVSWTPVLEINGTRHPLTRSRTVIGRGSDADITVDDTGISRKHVAILWDGTRGGARSRVDQRLAPRRQSGRGCATPARLRHRHRPNPYRVPRARPVGRDRHCRTTTGGIA